MAKFLITFLNVLTCKAEHIRSSSETLLEIVDLVLIFVLNKCMYSHLSPGFQSSAVVIFKPFCLKSKTELLWNKCLFTKTTDHSYTKMDSVCAGKSWVIYSPKWHLNIKKASEMYKSYTPAKCVLINSLLNQNVFFLYLNERNEPSFCIFLKFAWKH